MIAFALDGGVLYFWCRSPFLNSAEVFFVGVGCYRMRRSVAVVSTRGSAVVGAGTMLLLAKKFMLLLAQDLLCISDGAIGTGS
jgi:hypothetical protein